MDKDEFILEYKSLMRQDYLLSRESVINNILHGGIKILHISPSSGCNLDCSYCIAKKNIRNGKCFDFDKLVKKYDALVKNFNFEDDIIIHVLFHGEFLLYQEGDKSFMALLRYIIDSLKSRGVSVSSLRLVTNGMMPLTEDSIRFLKSLSCEVIFTVSYDGSDRINDTYRNSISGDANTSGRIKRFVSTLVANSFPYIIHSTVTDLWLGHEEEAIVSMKNNFSSAKKIEFDFVSVHDKMPDEMFRSNVETISEHASEIIMHLDDYSRLYGLDTFSMRLEPDNLTSFCHYCTHPILDDEDTFISCPIIDMTDKADCVKHPDEKPEILDSIVVGTYDSDGKVIIRDKREFISNVDFVPERCKSCDFNSFCGAKYCKWMWQNFERYPEYPCYYKDRCNSGALIRYSYDLLRKYPRLLIDDGKVLVEFLSMKKTLDLGKTFFLDTGSLLNHLCKSILSGQSQTDKLLFLYDKDIDSEKIRLLLPLLEKSGSFLRVLNYIPEDRSLDKDDLGSRILIPKSLFDALDILVFIRRGESTGFVDLLDGKEYDSDDSMNVRYRMKKSMNENILKNKSGLVDYDDLSKDLLVLKHYSSDEHRDRFLSLFS